MPLNVIKCANASFEALLSNNDINATAAAFEVRIDRTNLEDLSVHVSIMCAPSFWHFFFGDRVLRCIHKKRCCAKSLARIAYKAFQMKLDFDGIGIDPTSEIIAASHKKKIEEMRESGWSSNPFKLLNISQAKKGGFKVETRYRSVLCLACNHLAANKKCTHSMCKKCCMKIVPASCNTHSAPTDPTSIPPAAA